MARIALGIGISIGFLGRLGGKPPNFVEVIQWLGKTFESAGSWWMEDKTDNEFHVKLVESNVLTSDGSVILTFADLSGVTIVSQSGTSNAVKAGNTITISAGYIDDIVLSDGTHLRFSEGAGLTAYDMVGTNHAIISGGSSWTLEDVRPDNMLDGFAIYEITP